MKLVHGLHVLVYWNKRLMGQSIALDWEIASPRKAMTGLDSLQPYEITPIGSRVNGTSSIVRVHGDGGLEGRGIVATPNQIPREKYSSLLVIDRQNGRKLLQVDHVSIGAQKWRVNAKGRLECTFLWEGIIAFNEIDSVF